MTQETDAQREARAAQLQAQIAQLTHKETAATERESESESESESEKRTPSPAEFIHKKMREIEAPAHSGTQADTEQHQA